MPPAAENHAPDPTDAGYHVTAPDGPRGLEASGAQNHTPEGHPAAGSTVPGDAMTTLRPTVTGKMVFGKRFDLKLSSRDFARVLGVSHALVLRWEAGGKINPAHERLLALMIKKAAPALAAHHMFKDLMRPVHGGGDPVHAFLFLIGEFV